MSSKLATDKETTTTTTGDKETTTTTTGDKETTTTTTTGDKETTTTTTTTPDKETTTTTTDKEITTTAGYKETTTTGDKETIENRSVTGVVRGVRLSKRAKRDRKWFERQERQREGRREEKRRRDKRKREQEVSVRRRRIKLSDTRASKIHVAIDCTFDKLMSVREQEGLAKQIKYCYAANRNSSCPLQLHLCWGTGDTGHTGGIGDTGGIEGIGDTGGTEGIGDTGGTEGIGNTGGTEGIGDTGGTGGTEGTRDTGGVRGCLERTCPEYTRWDIHIHSESITYVFPTNQITYLTADSSATITGLSAESCYVIGGLLDHNRHKGACLKRAEGLGVRHARLGLEEVVYLNSRAVLAVNHVFDILLRYASSGSWREAVLGGLPARKISLIKTDPTGPTHTSGDQSEEDLSTGAI